MIEGGDPVPLAQALIRCPSITPEDNGAIEVLSNALVRLGFTCHRLTFEEVGTAPVDNLYARIGGAAPNLAFAGHTDVVPPGDVTAWRADPFAAELMDGVIYGRGAVDMKGAIASFTAAAARFLAEGMPRGSISLLITGDEEGVAINGTRKLLGWLKEQGEVIDACVVGEPTNPAQVGEMVKIGRRGSLTARLTVRGRQGHTAYPDQADNPIPRLLAMLGAITRESLDAGSEHFEPSRLELTSVDVGNPAANIIPAEARAAFNIRFNDRHSARSIEEWVRTRLNQPNCAYELEVVCSGEAFITLPGPLTELMESIIEQELGMTPELSTSGGTSDARFIKDVCPVVEFGLTSKTIHQVDERVSVADLEALTRTYLAFIKQYVRHA
jgi:succinyl-diaminopimelate desuccinylase